MIIGGWRGPGWQVFDADPRLGSQIRDWISSAISGHGCPVDAADAALVVSELFGNAVMHGPAGGRVLVGYCLWRQGARLVVCDGGGPGTPRLVHGGELAEGGRGLRVVDSLAARWGSFRAGRRAGGVVRFRAAAARCGQRRLGLAAPGLVGVRPVRPRPPGGRRDAGHAGCRGGTMSLRPGEAGARPSSRTGDPMTSDGGSRRPNVGRIYNYLLGGKDNYAEDRQAAGPAAGRGARCAGSGLGEPAFPGPRRPVPGRGRGHRAVHRYRRGSARPRQCPPGRAGAGPAGARGLRR